MRALKTELDNIGLRYKEEKEFIVKHLDKIVGKLRVDLIIE
jgi:hypothetical protein